MSYVRTYFPEWEDPLPGSEEGEVEYELTLADWQSQTAMNNRGLAPIIHGARRSFAMKAAWVIGMWSPKNCSRPPHSGGSRAGP